MSILPENLIFVEVLSLVLLPILAFLIGSISNAIIVCRIMNLPDPRTQGSNNPGATNVLRIGGKKAAAITLLADALKGGIPVLIAWQLGFELYLATLVGLFVFLGHVYPIWFGFKGGKGVATFLGMLFALNIWVGLASGLSWLFVARVLKISSLSALIVAALTPLYFYLITQNISATYLIILMSIWIFWTHRSNIKRLLDKQETKI